MRIAISSQGAGFDSPIDPRFGRAKYFIVVDTESGDFSPHDNTINLNTAQGAGIQAAKNVADLGVRAVVTGNVGPKAYATLSAAGIEIYIGAAGTVQYILDAFRAGKLSRADKANVDGHWV